MKRRMLAVAALASLAVAGPIAAAQGASSRAKVTQGVVFGGFLTQVVDGVTQPSYPIAIELSATGRKVVKAAIGMDLKCQTPGDITIPDYAENLAVSAAGKFSFEQPVTRIPADAARSIPPFDISAKFTGTVNKAKTRIKGTWQRKIVIYDPTGATVVDTCDSGVLRYSAKN